MQIKTRLTEADFIKANFALLWKRPFLKVVFGIILAIMIYSIFIQVKYGVPVSFDMVSWPLIALVFFPLSTFIAAKLSYKSNARIKETIEYFFEDDFLEIRGESFSSKLTWPKIYKVSKTRDWLLIWQSRQIANVIPLRDVWEGDILKLKEILNRHDVKNNL